MIGLGTPGTLKALQIEPTGLGPVIVGDLHPIINVGGVCHDGEADQPKELTQDRFRGRLPTGQRPTQVAPLQTDEDSQLLVRN